jgi:ketose-bisphosphate aldolase
MLVSPQKGFKKLVRNKEALAHFNVNNLEMVKAVSETAEKMNQSVFIAVTENAIEYAGFDYLINIIKTAGKESSTDLYLHLDHGKSASIIKRAIKSGFNSIMYDGSSLPIAENIAKTKEIKQLIGTREIVLEAEIGHVGKLTDEDRGMLSQPKEVREFVKKTGADMVAVSVGTVHGIVKDQKIDFGLLAEIRSSVDLPLVIHGCSGLSQDQVRRLIDHGGNKFNFDSEIRAAFMNGLRENISESDPRRALSASMTEMRTVVEQKLNWLS